MFEITTMKKSAYKCNVAEAGDIHHQYTRISLPNDMLAESNIYNDTEYGNKARIVLSNIISIFFSAPYRNMGKQCAMLSRSKLVCYK